MTQHATSYVVHPGDEDSSLHHEITAVLNRNSAENASDTPDFILATFLMDCLAAWDRAHNERSGWYGDDPHTLSQRLGQNCGCPPDDTDTTLEMP